jgi:hypothetical protein
MIWKKLQKFIDVINSYYGFALLLYAGALYISGHNRIFLFIAIAAAPLLAGWSGYLLNGYFQRRNQHYGFGMKSDRMTLEIINKTHYILRFTTQVKAEADHLFTYPISYKWSGKGEEGIPKVSGKNQQLLGVINSRNEFSESAHVSPYKEVVSSEGEWHYWMVGINPVAYRGDEVTLEYEQSFNDKERVAKPYLGYFVRVPMKKLELNVKFPKGLMPTEVTGSYVKPSDPRHVLVMDKITYDKEKQWASLIIHKPKRGYYYRIDWR